MVKDKKRQYFLYNATDYNNVRTHADDTPCRPTPICEDIVNKL